MALRRGPVGSWLVLRGSRSHYIVFRGPKPEYGGQNVHIGLVLEFHRASQRDSSISGGYGSPSCRYCSNGS